MFMDDKSYPYLKLSKEKAPILRVVRNTKDKKQSTLDLFQTVLLHGKQ